MEENINLTDLFNINLLQELQDSFFLSNGISVGISDQNGIAITEHCSCNPFCSEYTKKTAEGLKRCQECDKEGTSMAVKKGGPILYNCYAGMLEFAIPIIVDGRAVGTIHGGQVTDHPIDESVIRHLAADFGLDEEEYLEAARKTPVVERKHMENSATFLHTVANIMSHIAYKKYHIQLASTEIEREANMKSDFLANMSHEIRTPMNAVIGMAEMALREEMTPTARDYINQIKTAGNSLLTIINDILDFSKINAGKMEINLAEYEPLSIIHDVTNIIMTRIGDKDLALIIDCDPNIPNQLMGDSIRIKQVIMNLANNAVKFTKEGYVKLIIGFEETDDSMITLKVAIKDTGIGIKKEDTAKLFQSFQQVDSKRNRNIEGSGLGLSISKQLIELMHGKIWMESVYGSGSTFFFDLPQIVIQKEPSITLETNEPPCVATLSDNPYVTESLARDLKRFRAEHIILPLENPLEKLELSNARFLFVDFPVYNDDIKSYIAAHPDLTAALMIEFKNTWISDLPNMLLIKKPMYALNIGAIINQDELLHDYDSEHTEQFNFIAPDASILIVDDNEVNLTVARGLMEPFKMHIDTASGGKEAIQRISIKHYDLIFMDHMMPELDGIETTHIIRRFHEEYNDVPIIALTANAMEEMRSKFLTEGMNDFIAKPIEMHMLERTLLKWLPKEKVQKASKELKKTSDRLDVADLDTKAALHYLGSEELFWKVLEDFYKIIDKKSTLIEESYRKADWKNYTIEVHALKSAAKQIGATELSEHAAALEAAGNAENLELIRSDTDLLLAEYRHYQEVLQQYFKQEEAEEETEKEAITHRILFAMFNQLQEAIDNLDMDSMEEVIQSLDHYLYDQEQQLLLNRLKEAVDILDVDACEATIKEWRILINEDFLIRI